ncbi:MAG: DNA repair protein RecO [Candidatus Omnitrophota bacterium]|nr:MAG: DNA repair protein RecO [Candidatus Omnitrophota bacterium]
MSIHKTEALVLNKWDFRETSIIAKFYTRDFGKFSGLFKGIRKEPQKFASSVDIFSFNEIVFYKKNNSQLYLVSQCDLRDNFTGIRGSMDKIPIASFIVELLGAIVPFEEPNQEILDLTLQCLKQLETSPNADKIKTIYTVKVLALSGFKPHLDSCVSCGAKFDGSVKFSFQLGGLLCMKCALKDPKARSIYRGTIASILYIERNDFSNILNLGMNPQIKKELGLVLNSFLQYHLEKELKSQKVLDNIANFTPTLEQVY